MYYADIDEADLPFHAGGQDLDGKAETVFEHASTFTVVFNVHPGKSLSLIVQD